MRRAVSVLAAFVLAAAMAAPASAQGLRLGVEGGVNIANVSVTPDADTESLTGIRGGVSATIPLSEAFGLRSGAFYSQKGFETTILGTTAEFGVDYIEVPLLGVYTIPVEGSFRPQIFGGGLVGFEASCEISGGGSTTDCGNQTKSTDFGLLFGGSLGYAISENAVIKLDGGYNLGLADVAEGSGEVKHRVFQVGAGVEFAL